MKNYLNCHTKGVHSFPVWCENGLYRRVFIAEHDHDLWKPFEIAIHPHHVDICITVIHGCLINQTWKLSSNGIPMYAYSWQSHISGNGGSFSQIGIKKLEARPEISHNLRNPEFSLFSNELHSVRVAKGRTCAWIVDEHPASNNYDAVTYSPHDLTKWTPEGLYIEVGNDVKQHYFNKYVPQKYLTK